MFLPSPWKTPLTHKPKTVVWACAVATSPARAAARVAVHFILDLNIKRV